MSAEKPQRRIIHLDHLVDFEPTRLPDGRFRARAVVTALASTYTIAQRFIDLEVFDDEQEAVERGRQQGIAWVDQEIASRRARRP